MAAPVAFRGRRVRRLEPFAQGLSPRHGCAATECAGAANAPRDENHLAGLCLLRTFVRSSFLLDHARGARTSRQVPAAHAPPGPCRGTPRSLAVGSGVADAAAELLLPQSPPNSAFVQFRRLMCARPIASWRPLEFCAAGDFPLTQRTVSTRSILLCCRLSVLASPRSTRTPCGPPASAGLIRPHPASASLGRLPLASPGLCQPFPFELVFALSLSASADEALFCVHHRKPCKEIALPHSGRSCPRGHATFFGRAQGRTRPSVYSMRK